MSGAAELLIVVGGGLGALAKKTKRAPGRPQQAGREMEKSTISALIVAGAAVVGGLFQALVLRAAKKKREASEYEKRTGLADADDGSTGPDADS